MRIDFAPVRSQEITMIELAKRYSQDDLRAATHEYLDFLLEIVNSVNDAQLFVEPNDPDANDPYSKPGEERIGWSLAHLVLHTTASMEESAAFSSILARGVAVGGRLRYEQHWKEVATRAEVLQRIAESRRMCLAYLDTWPDKPHLDVFRQYADSASIRTTPPNGPASYLNGLSHGYRHIDQIRRVAGEAGAATATRS